MPVSKFTKSIVYSLALSAIIFTSIGPSIADEYCDAVLFYDCSIGGLCPAAVHQNTAHILGIEDGDTVSLGLGGIIEVAFIDNFLTNNGNSDDDIKIFELGADVEATLVAVRPTPETALILGSSFDANGDGYYELGEVSGSISTLDLDAIFPGFVSGQLKFNAVQLIDNEFELGSGSGSHGADIDAVQAFSAIFLGDINLDGLTNLLDVAPFVELLSSGIYQNEGDINGDGSVNLLDVELFIDLLG